MLEGFFVFRQPKQLAELLEELDAQWRPANFKADWPVVQRIFGSEVHIWDSQPAQQTAGSGSNGSRGSGVVATSKRAGPVNFHKGRDFDWEELRARHEEILLRDVAVAAGHARAASAAGSACVTEAMSAQVDGWERHFVRHAAAPSLFFKERRYLLDQFPMLRQPSPVDGGPLRILETGCGNGSSVLPILKGNPSAFVHATDPSETAVSQTCKVVASQDGDLASRLTTEVQPALTEPCSPPHIGSFDVALIVFTLSAVPGDGDARLLESTARAVKRGGRVLIRDYGLYDLRHLGDAASSELIVSAAAGDDNKVGSTMEGAPSRKLRAGAATFQYRRPGGMFRRYYTLEDVAKLAANAGLVVEESKYLCIRLRNERKDLTMDRVYVSAVLQRAE